MARITFIGAGSLGFTRGLVRDILTFPLMRDAELVLMDIDEERLDFAKRACETIVERGEYPAKVTATMDRRSGRDRRKAPDRRKKDVPVTVERRKTERREKVNRRRQIDPTTCERDYSYDEIEFMNAMDEYKRTSGRMFPTCSEVLEVIKKLGYEKRPLGKPSEPPAEADSEPAPTAPDGPIER